MTEWMGIANMKLNNVGYLLKEGIRSIFLHGFMSFAAVCVTVACLLIVGSFSVLMYNLNITVDNLNKTNEVVVYINDQLSEPEARSVGTQINQIENVENAQFVSNREAFETFKEGQNNDPVYDGVDPDVLRHRFVVTLMDNSLFRDTVQQLQQIDGVGGIRADQELADGFSTLQNILRIASFAVIALLLVVSLLIISNTVKIAMYDRREEISIMKMVGATNGFIRLPFIVEGFTLGMLGAAIAFGLEWLLYDALRSQISGIAILRAFNFVPFSQLLWPMVATFTAAGFFVGIVGSWNSIRKFMNV